jgi:uracil-DNA glycosylase
MCFSVKPGVKVPPSLANMYRELQDDLGHRPVSHGHLASWAGQGVMLLNAVLTVKANQANSHKDHGWETFTDAVITALAARKKPAVFLLWGNKAQSKELLLDTARHRVLKAGHPSPLSAKSFFGTKPFSKANDALKELGLEPVNWQLPDDPAQVAAKPAAAPAPATTAPPPAKAAPDPVVVSATVLPDEVIALAKLLPADWKRALTPELSKPYFRQLDQFLAAERKSAIVCPGEESVFAALHQTPLADVKVVMLGQEPIPASDVCDGLAFSVREGVEPSALLRTIGKELRRDLGCRLPVSGSLAPWARQGVLLLNHVLTVREGRPGSHNNKGWETFTDAVVKLVSDAAARTVFVFLGNVASKKRALIDPSRHVVLTAAHPGLAPDDFLGGGLFSAINSALDLGGRSSVYWQLPYA